MRKRGFTLTEIIVVLGIISLAMGTMLSFLIAGRSSVDVSEARLQASEYAQRAIAQIAKELRLSNPFRVRITHAIGWTLETRPAEVINFQIPVGIYGTLDLAPGNWLKWGTEATESYIIAYSLDANSQLLRSTYDSSSPANAVSRVITPRISSLTFDRADLSSDIISITIIAQVPGPFGSVKSELRSQVKLRN